MGKVSVFWVLLALSVIFVLMSMALAEDAVSSTTPATVSSTGPSEVSSTMPSEKGNGNSMRSFSDAMKKGMTLLG